MLMPWYPTSAIANGASVGIHRDVRRRSVLGVNGLAARCGLMDKMAGHAATAPIDV